MNSEICMNYVFREASKVESMSETLQLRGTLRGHNGWVTQITTNPKYPDMILSSSRDKSLIVWKLNRDEAGNYDYDLNDILHYICICIIQMTKSPCYFTRTPYTRPHPLPPHFIFQQRMTA